MLLPSTRSMTEMQAKLVEGYCSGKSIGNAAKDAGYANAAAGYVAFRSPTVQAAVKDFVERSIKTEGATLAYRTLVKLLEPGNSGSVRLGAANSIMKMAGLMDIKDGDKREKPLTDMSADELQAAITKFDQQLAGLADGAKPVGRTVIENETGTDEA